MNLCNGEVFQLRIDYELVSVGSVNNQFLVAYFRALVIIRNLDTLSLQNLNICMFKSEHLNNICLFVYSFVLITFVYL